MNCKFCNAEMDENHKFCPFCGKDQSVEDLPEVIETTPEMTAEEVRVKEPKKKVWPIVVGIIGAVFGLAFLAVTLLAALGALNLSVLLPRENNIMAKDVYIVADDKAAKKADDVVATMGDKVLTNAQLQIYYRMQVTEFLSYYSSYLSQLGIDLSVPLSEQKSYYDETLSWEQFFVEKAIETWQNYQAVALMAEEAAYELPADWQESLDTLPAELESQATSGGYESTNALLADVIGPACDLDTYMEYVKLAYLSNAYYVALEEELMPTTEEVEAYFAQNEDVFAQEGVTKDAGNVASVRHLLVMPEGGVTVEETQETVYTEEELAAALKKAEDLLKQWKAGDATEESFAALVEENTDDSGSLGTGGLYENIAPGSSYVEEFLAWAIDPARVVGETDIVKTQFGYHIMYYVSGVPYWMNQATIQLASDRMTAKTNEAEVKWPIEITFKKIALAELNLE